MTIARRLRWYLDSHGVDYEVLPHERSATSLQTARQAHIAPEALAKCVLLEDERGYLMAVLPASHRIELERLGAVCGRRLELASEPELGELFRDCEVGAVPPLGDAYGIPTLIEDRLLEADEVYFEAGDHEDVVHLDGASFRDLMASSLHARFSRPS